MDKPVIDLEELQDEVLDMILKKLIIERSI